MGNKKGKRIFASLHELVMDFLIQNFVGFKGISEDGLSFCPRQKIMKQILRRFKPHYKVFR
jgi:hypothetical protein